MVGPDSSHGVSRVVHHKDFYLRGGDMTVLVENHLYRIHSYFFDRESLFFRQKLSSTSSGDDEERGSTDRNAYTLEDVKSEDFARFLWVFYNPKYSVYDAPLETWISILNLANRWSFDNVKELSVRELEKIDIEPAEKIAIYHDHNISRLYLIPSYVAICKRDRPMSFVEGHKLGMETVLRIAEARERLRLQASESGIRTPTFEDIEDAEVEVLIRDIFSLGPRAVSPSPVTPANASKSSSNGVPKLNTPPTGNSAKANAAFASRANGGSATDPRVSSVNSTASIISPQAPAAATPATAMQTSAAPPPPPATTQTVPTRTTASREPQAPEALVTAAQAIPTSPPPPPPASDKPKDPKEAALQETSSIASLLSPVSGLESRAGSRDAPISKSVVPPTEHSNDVPSESNDNMNETEKDETGKDNDVASVMSDTDGGRGGKQGGKNRRRTGGAARQRK